MLTVLIVGMIAVVSRDLLAQGAVCGDGTNDAGEECDDGNLRSGDGCSNQCLVEQCGNKRVDAHEQCDDGNTKVNDGCTQYCQIEFCGDSNVQPALGEQCDDGNNVPGDGCTETCLIGPGIPAPPRAEEPGATPPKFIPILPDHGSAPPLDLVTAPPLVVQEAAKEAGQFLASPEGEDIKQSLSREEGIQLDLIVQKLEEGRRLTTDERAWAAVLFQKLEATNLDGRKRFTDLLRRFIATPISSEVVKEKNLRSDYLVDREVPIVIAELGKAIQIIRRGELRSRVAANIARLRRQRIDVTGDVPADYAFYLDPSSRPIAVFAMLKALKEATEQFATTDLAASLAIIRKEAKELRGDALTLKAEYGIAPEDFLKLLDGIETAASSIGPDTPAHVASAVERLLKFLERRGVFSITFIDLLERQRKAAQSVYEIAKELGKAHVVVDDATARAFAVSLGANLTPERRSAFTEGTLSEQRNAITDLLEQDPRVSKLRSILVEVGRSDFEERYIKLKADIAAVGDPKDVLGPCDDSMSEALKCVREYLTDLEAAVRARSVYSRLIGFLQDLFGIGS